MARRTERKGRKLGTLAPLSAEQRRALAGLREAKLVGALYLGGGVAVAHHLGHRVSNDLVLFSRKPDLALEGLRRPLVDSLGAEVVDQSDATLRLEFEGAAIDVVRYPYRTLGRFSRGPEGVSVASVRDLAAMKLAAIAKRGVKRDY